MRYASIAPVVALAIAAATLASVFVYYPLQITITPTEPGVVFWRGTNAGQADIGIGNTITVTVNNKNTSASVEIHPTYQKNYYKNVLQIHNGDDDMMNVSLIFRKVENSLPQGSVVVLFVIDNVTKSKVKELTITNVGVNTTAYWIDKISSKGNWSIDLYVYIPGGSDLTNARYEARIELVYTPSDEKPPIQPHEGG